MKKQIVLFLMTLLPVVAWADDSGTCGENLTWTYEEATGTLTISGTGEMTDYSVDSSELSPWNSFSANIQCIIISEGVSSIGSMAFWGCTNVSSVVFPSSVAKIGNGAFYGCSGLISITIPSTVIDIVSNPFQECSGIQSIHVDEANAFYDSRNDCNAIIRTSDNYLIFGCSNTVIPNDVITIGWGAFDSCTGLNSLTIPSSVTTFERYAFYGCTGLTSLTFSEGITDIGSYFSGCTGLTSLIIPSTVTSIGKGAFSGCKDLASVISYMVIPPIIGTNDFSDITKTSGTLYIPAGTRNIYIEKGWSLCFANIVEMEDGEPIWLSIVDAEQGCTELRCKAGETYTFRFKPADGWHVHSVMFRGADVTSWLTDEGEFTTPAMSASTDLVITYEQGTNAVKAIADESDMRVVVINNDIVIRNAPAGTPIHVYDLSGKLIGETTVSEAATNVSTTGHEKVVIVRVGERSMKVRRD